MTKIIGTSKEEGQQVAVYDLFMLPSLMPYQGQELLYPHFPLAFVSLWSLTLPLSDTRPEPNHQCCVHIQRESLLQACLTF